jgi:hypothetical protein
MDRAKNRLTTAYAVGNAGVRRRWDLAEPSKRDTDPFGRCTVRVVPRLERFTGLARRLGVAADEVSRYWKRETRRRCQRCLDGAWA